MRKDILYLFVGAFLAIGLIFKFMHWQGAGIVLSASLFATTIALVSFSIYNKKSTSLKRKLFYPLLGIIYVLGLLFKIMHWHGADILLITSISGLSLALVEFSFSIRKSVCAILPLLFSITLFFALFKILHWPRPSYVLYGSYFLFSFCVPLFLFFRAYKLKNTEPNISSHFMLLAVFSIVLCAVEVKAKIYPEVLGMEKYMHYMLNIFLISGLVLLIRKTLDIKQFKIKLNIEYKLVQSLGCMYMILMLLYVLVSRN